MYTYIHTHIPIGDQCVFNIYLALHPEKMREAPCVLNYRTEHCRYGENCKLAQEAGIGLLHGSRGVFHKAYGDNQAFMSFALVYDTFFHHPFGQESILLSDVESNANEDGDGPHDRTDGGDCSRAGEARGECVDASKERHRLDPERKGHHTRQMKQVLLSLMKEMRDSPPLHQPRYARCAALPLLPAWKVGKWEEELGEEAYAYDLWKAIDDGEAEIEMREGHDDDCDIHDDKHHDHASNDYRNENEYENGNDDIDNSNHENENRNRNENGNDDDNGTDDVDSDGKRDNLVDTQTSNNPITLVERLAYATLLTSTSYLPGVLTLIQSLRTHSTLTQAGACDVVVMMNEVPGKEIEELLLYPSLNTQGNIKVVRVKNIDHPMSVNNNIESGDGHGKTRSGPSISSFADTYTKLRMWELTQYDTIVYLDADTLIMQNPDTLFKQRHAQERRQNERSGTDNSVDRADDNHRNDDFNHKLGNDRKTIRDKANDTSSQPAASCERYGVSAAPDCCPPLVFNSGVMVLVPCRSTFSKMMRGLHTMQQVALQGDTAIEHSKYKLALLFGENEFLHMFFPQYRQLHYGFNMGQYTYAVQRRMEHYTKHSVNMVKIYHFTGRKPWLYVPSGALTEAERDEKTSFPGWKQPYYKLWWSVFLNFFHSSSSACAKVGSSECHSRLDRVISKYTSSSHQVKGFFTRNQHLTDLPFYRLGANVLTRGVDSS